MARVFSTETKSRMYGECSFFHWSAGESHTKLRDDLEDLRGSSAAVGLYPHWLEDTEDVISAYVPDEDGEYDRDVIDTQPNPRLKNLMPKTRALKARFFGTA